MTTTSLQKLLQNIREQIAQGELQLALDQLKNYLAASDGDLYNEAILDMARYDRIRREERKGTLTREEARVEQAKLEDNVLALLKEIPKKISREKSPSSLPVVTDREIPIPDEVKLEKILGVNNLKQISWIEQGIQVAKSVCRILTPNGMGTGFLISSNLLMTNHHVIASADIAADPDCWVEFNYQLDSGGTPLQTHRYRLDAERFHTNPTLDYTIVGVLADPDKSELTEWGNVLLNSHADPVPGEHVIIIQHPNGGLKQIALTANQVVSSWEHRLHYTTDTMPGSSGSPVFNDLWQVIAIHHAGGKLQTNASGDKRFVNEGILMSAIRLDAGDLWPQ
jgi:endonuclease G